MGTENSTALDRTAITPVSTYIRFRKSSMGMMAFGCRISITTNPTSNTPAATSSPTVIADPHPYASYAHPAASSPATVAVVSTAAP